MEGPCTFVMTASCLSLTPWQANHGFDRTLSLVSTRREDYEEIAKFVAVLLSFTDHLSISPDPTLHDPVGDNMLRGSRLHTESG